MTQEALKLALEGVEIHSPNSPEYIVCAALIEALRENAMREVQRLGQEIEQEPVAWEQFYPDIGKPQLTYPPQGIYYTPPQRTWVGLTNNELQPIADEYRILFGSWVEDFARAIEAKLKDKNDVAQKTNS
jgi:hypothetical protein